MPKSQKLPKKKQCLLDNFKTLYCLIQDKKRIRRLRNGRDHSERPFTINISNRHNAKKISPGLPMQETQRLCVDYRKLYLQLLSILGGKSSAVVTLVVILKIDQMLARL